MPNISDKLREFFGDPTIPGQAVEEVLMNAKARGYGPGGNNPGVLKVTFTYDHGEYTADKTFSEIVEAWQNGSYILGIVDGDVLQLGGIDVGFGVYFGQISYMDGDTVTQLYNYTYGISADNEVYRFSNNVDIDKPLVITTTYENGYFKLNSVSYRIIKIALDEGRMVVVKDLKLYGSKNCDYVIMGTCSSTYGVYLIDENGAVITFTGTSETSMNLKYTPSS